MSQNLLHTASPPAQSDVDSLVSENKLLRILQPAIEEQVKQDWRRNKPSPCVVEYDGHLYISLSQVEDEAKRKYFYRLIQQHQTGERVNLKELPQPIQHILEPELTQAGRMMGAILLGSVAGIVVGILGLALTIFVVNGITWLTSRSFGQIAGMELPAVSFVVFTFVGWAAAGFLAWCKPHLWVNLSNTAENLRRKNF